MTSDSSQVSISAAVKRQSVPHTSQVAIFIATGHAPPRFTNDSQYAMFVAYSGGLTNVSTYASQAGIFVAYKTAAPAMQISTSWTFVLDGHRFYVLPFGQEGDWAYDLTTHEWCQLQSQGFYGLNFTHGVMWGLRIIGGDALYTYLYELDPTQPFDESWREVEHKVTGGIATRTRSVIGVANFTLTASVDDESATDQSISLAYSDDNGATWSQEFDVMLTDEDSQVLIWSALGSFAAPGRVFRITDYSGPIRLDGADVVLTTGTGADTPQDGSQ